MRKPLLLTAILILATISALMAQPAPKISKSDLPTWLKPISQKPHKVNLDDISLGYYYELMEKQVHLGLQADYNNTITVVSEESGAENAGHINVVFDPSYQKLIVHRLQVERDGEIQNRLDLSKFKVVATESDLKRFIYNGTYSAFTLLEDIRKGDKITFSYSIIGFNPVFEGKYANSYYLEGGEPVGLVHLVYLVPDGRILNIRKQMAAAPEKKIKKEGLTYYYWEQPALASEPYVSSVPMWFNQSQKIEVSEFSTWKQVADWAKRINPIPTLKAGSDLDKFVQKTWEESGKDQTIFFQKSLDFVQNSVRYMGIEMGENSHRAHSPELVFKQRYGDCKDKSLLLASMLASKGIESSLVLANTYQDKELDKVQPSPFAFNHMVLAVFIGSQLKAVDPTISNQGGPVMERYFPPYGKVLSINNAVNLDEIEKSSKDGFLIRIEDVFQLLSGTKANLNVTTTYKHSEADAMRTYLKENAKNQVQKDYEDYYAGIYKKAKRIKPLKIKDDLENNILIVYEVYELDEYLLTDESASQKLAPAYSKSIYDRLPKVQKDRVLPVSLEFPVDVEHFIKIINKDKSSVGAYRSEEIIERDSYFYSKTFYTSKDTMIIKNVFITNDSFIPMDQVSQYSEDYTNLENQLLYSMFVNDDGQIFIGIGNGFEINYWALLAFVLVILASAWVIWVKYNNSKPTKLVNLYHENVQDSIGGWLILLGISLVIGNLASIATLLSEGSPLNASLWKMVNSSTVGNSTLLFIILVLYLVLFAIIIMFNVYTAILFFKKRDLFPQSFLYLNLASFILVMCSYMLVYFSNSVSSFTDVYTARDVWDFIIIIAWSLYIYNSVRVKETFTVSYFQNENDSLKQENSNNLDNEPVQIESTENNVKENPGRINPQTEGNEV